MQFSPHNHGGNLYVDFMGLNKARNPENVLGRVNLLSLVYFPFVPLWKVSRDTAEHPRQLWVTTACRSKCSMVKHLFSLGLCWCLKICSKANRGSPNSCGNVAMCKKRAGDAKGGELFVVPQAGRHFAFSPGGQPSSGGCQFHGVLQLIIQV